MNGLWLCCILPVLFVASCHTAADTSQTEEKYYGPMQEGEGLETYYTEDDLIKAKVIAPKVYQFQNGDREFPEGIRVEFYEKGHMISSLKAENAYYFKKYKKWRGQGKVEVNNVDKNQLLRTDELYWTTEDQRIRTEKRIIINFGNEILYGKGLDAAQDLSDYIVKQPIGEFEIDDE